MHLHSSCLEYLIDVSFHDCIVFLLLFTLRFNLINSYVDPWFLTFKEHILFVVVFMTFYSCIICVSYFINALCTYLNYKVERVPNYLDTAICWIEFYFCPSFQSFVLTPRVLAQMQKLITSTYSNFCNYTARRKTITEAKLMI